MDLPTFDAESARRVWTQAVGVKQRLFWKTIVRDLDPWVGEQCTNGVLSKQSWFNLDLVYPAADVRSFIIARYPGLIAGVQVESDGGDERCPGRFLVLFAPKRRE